VQYGILGRTEDEGKTMSAVVAEYDQISVEFARHAQELYLHTPDLDSPAGRPRSAMVKLLSVRSTATRIR
jgi:hypothetical protein